MNKICVEYETMNPTTATFIDGFNKISRCLNLTVEYIQTKNFNNTYISNSDVLLSLRPFLPLSVEIIRAAKAQGCFCIVFYDDDLLQLNTEYYGILKQRKECIPKLLEYTDVILSSNSLIASEYSLFIYSKRSFVLNTPIAYEDIFKRRIVNDGTIRIVYAAGKDHAHLFEHYISPVLQYIFDEFDKRIDLTFIGVAPDIGKFIHKRNVHYLPILPFSDYRKHMSNSCYDIGLAPLDDNNFSNRKYFNKFIEYSMAGIVGIYSNCKPYTYIIQNMENGFLANNTPDAWYKALRLAINNSELRNKCIDKAQVELITKFNVKNISYDLVKNIPELINYSASNTCNSHLKFIKIKYYLFIIKETLYKILYYIKKEGIIYMLQKAFVHIIDNIKYKT